MSYDELTREELMCFVHQNASYYSDLIEEVFAKKNKAFSAKIKKAAIALADKGYGGMWFDSLELFNSGKWGFYPCPEEGHARKRYREVIAEYMFNLAKQAFCVKSGVKILEKGRFIFISWDGKREMEYKDFLGNILPHYNPDDAIAALTSVEKIFKEMYEQEHKKCE